MAPTSVETERECFSQDIDVIRPNEKMHQISSLFLILSRMDTINLVYKLDLYPFRNVLQGPLDFFEGLASEPLCWEGEMKQLTESLSVIPGTSRSL